MPLDDNQFDFHTSTPAAGGNQGGGKDPSPPVSSPPSSTSTSTSTTAPPATTTVLPYVTAQADAAAKAKPEKPQWMKDALARVLDHKLETDEDKQDLADELGIMSGALTPAVEGVAEDLVRGKKRPVDLARLFSRRPTRHQRKREKLEEDLPPSVRDQVILSVQQGTVPDFDSGLPEDATRDEVLRHVQSGDLWSAEGRMRIDRGTDLVRNRAFSRLDREKVLGVDKGRKQDQEDQKRKWNAGVKPMSWEEYEALNPRQRAAVDFNGALVQAVAEDRENKGLRKKATDAEREEYRQQLREMFGRKRGSKLYAPQTVALLSELDLEDKAGDLDDYLSLRTAITARDLKHFEAPSMEHGPTVAFTEAMNEAVTASPAEQLDEQLVQATLDLTRELAKSRRLVQDFRISVQNELNLSAPALGGRAVSPETFATMPGFGDWGPEDNWTFDGFVGREYIGLAMLRDPDERAARLEEIKSKLTDQQFQDFLNYVDVNTSQAMRYKVDSRLPEKGKFARPRKIRRSAGLLKWQQEKEQAGA